MATALLGPEIDIHCGGVDNIFPHHEAEIAQSESCTGKRFVRYWLHCAHLLVDGQKMSKSLGNFYTLRDLLAQGYTGREIRYALLTVNYRLPLNFTFAGLDAARAALARIDEWALRLADSAGSAAPEPTPLSGFADRFFADLDNDLNSSGAMGQLFELVRETNRALDSAMLSAGQAAQLAADWRSINTVLTLSRDSTAISAEVLALVEQRQQARAAKNWADSDRLRNAIAAAGWNLKDTKDGPKLSPSL